MDVSTLQTITKNVASELDIAASGMPTSFPFILHQLPEKPLVADGEEFLVLVVGGTIYIRAVCKKENGSIVIVHKENGNNPPFHTAQDFLTFIETHIPENIGAVAVNFAFPMKPVFRNQTTLDGVLLNGTKEYTFDGLVGKGVGEEIEKYLHEKRGQTLKVAVANDTICELLSGLNGHYNKEELACGIVGTGLNFAFFTDETHAVNLEAANFDKFPQSTYGKQVDINSVMPGTSLFEKETSGAYLFQHFNLFTKEKGIDNTIQNTHELDHFAKACSTTDKNEACTFAFDLLERSAALVATEIAGITAYKKHNMTFIMAGSLFWKGFNYKENVEKYLKQLVPDYTVSCINIENCEIYGAAKLVA